MSKSIDKTEIRFAANREDQDFPEWTAKVPERCYIIASTPRCGSTLLSKALAATGLCGRPHEYFNHLHVEDFDRRWDFFPPDLITKNSLARGRRRPVPDLGRYTSGLIRHRTSPNGVFGAKIHYCHIDSPMMGGVWPHQLFPGARFIHISRENTVRQGVSHVKKGLLGVEQTANAKNRHKLVYDGESLLSSVRWMEEQNRAWTKYFDRFQLPVFPISYEEIVGNYEEGIRSVLSFLEIDFPGTFEEPPTRSESDEYNEDWERRFRKEFGKVV